jgi:beta-N-acetylhexosaminidase
VTDPELGRLAHQVLMGAFDGPAVPDRTRRELDRGLGSVCLYGANLVGPGGSRAQVADVTARLHDAAPDVVVCVDEEGGDVTRLHYGQGSPHAGAAVLGRVDDVGLTRAAATALGHDLRAVGIDLDLAPVVDVNSEPDNPVIGTRSFGADPSLAARHTTAWVEGLQAVGVGACVKHFPGHGATTVDSHAGLPTVDVPYEVLAARDLPPFLAAARAGALAVMTSHVLLPALDPRWPATLSAPVLAMLRRELGEDTLVVTDALDMAGASGGRGVPAAAVLALRAGADLLCLGPAQTGDETDEVVAAVLAAVAAGDLPGDRLEEAASRVVAAQEWVARGRALPAAEPDLSWSLTAARRAVEVSGRLPGLEGATVVRLDAGTNPAVGQVPWGIAPDGAVVVRDRVTDLGEGDRPPAGPGPLVALVREAHRHPWVLEALRAAVAGGRDVVVVETGWASEHLESLVPGAAALVRTWGGGAASARAVDELLAPAR